MLSNTPKDDDTRAERYSLISSLFLGRADERFLSRLKAAPRRPIEQPSAWTLESIDHEVRTSPYSIAFQSLQAICQQLGEEAIRHEYEALFLGGAAVSASTSCYAAPDAPVRHLQALRDYLVSRGLARRDSAVRFEDHVSAVCDVMQWLIERQRPIEEQCAFFNEFVHKSVGAFCDAVETRRHAAFYRAVAVLARAFIQQELVTLEARLAEQQEL